MSADRQKIAFVADCLVHAQAGTERQMTRLREALIGAGWECQVAVLRSSTYTDSEACPVPVECLNIGSLANPASWWRAASFAISLRWRGVRIAHLFFNDTSVLLPPFLKAAGITVVISRRDMGFWYTPGLLRVLRRVRWFVDAVVVNSNAVAAHTAACEGYPKDRISVIHNALDPQFGVGIALSAEGPPIVGIVANIRPVKRIEDAVQVVAGLTGQFPELRLRIVGGGDPLPIRQCAEAAGIADRIDFAGPTDNPAAEMARFTIGLLTSETEGFSNTLMEYQQLGLSVVSSDGGGNPEIVAHDISGLVYPAGDVAALTGCLKKLLEDADLRQRLGQQAQETVNQLCDPARVLSEHRRLYDSLLGTGALVTSSWEGR